jgi:hypothetical protein
MKRNRLIGVLSLVVMLVLFGAHALMAGQQITATKTNSSGPCCEPTPDCCPPGSRPACCPQGSGTSTGSTTTNNTKLINASTTATSTTNTNLVKTPANASCCPQQAPQSSCCPSTGKTGTQTIKATEKPVKKSAKPDKKVF